jgi:hypothetical protein
MDEVLQQAVDQACKPDSVYMSFLPDDEINREHIREIEARIDVPVEQVPALTEAALAQGWRLAPQECSDGRVFLSRDQKLSDAALFDLFRDALTLAYAYRGRFHSWLPASDLDTHA